MNETDIDMDQEFYYYYYYTTTLQYFVLLLLLYVLCTERGITKQRERCNNVIMCVLQQASNNLSVRRIHS